MRLKDSPLRHGRAFSLIELIVVMTIIALVATLATSGLSSISRANSLGSATQGLAGQFALARQAASARGVPIEVRIYQLPDFEAQNGAAAYWRAVQVFDATGPVPVPLSRIFFFPRRAIIDDKTSVSPLLAKMATGNQQINSFGTTSWPYRAITVRPNQRVTVANIPSDQEWFLTIRQENDKEVANGLPANFATLQINPFTARIIVLRP